MNEYQRQNQTPVAINIAVDGISNIDSSSYILGSNSERIRHNSFCRPFINFLRKDWTRNRIVLKLRRPLYSIPLRYRQAGSIVVHLITIAVTASYLTLAIFASENAETYWWWYAILVLALQVSGLFIPQGRKRDGA